MPRSQKCLYLISKRGAGHFTNSKRLGNRAGNKCRVTDRRQPYENRAVDEIGSDILDELKGEARLADARRPGQGKQVCPGTTQQFKYMEAFLFSPNQSSRRNGKFKRRRASRGINKGSG